MRKKEEKQMLDVSFWLFRNMTCPIHQASEGLSKSSTKDVLGIDIDNYRKSISFQMTPDVNWSIVEIDHGKLISSMEVSKKEELSEAFNWRNTEPLGKLPINTKELRLFALNTDGNSSKLIKFLS